MGGLPNPLHALPTARALLEGDPSSSPSVHDSVALLLFANLFGVCCDDASVEGPIV